MYELKPITQPAARHVERARAKRHLESLRHAFPWPPAYLDEALPGFTLKRWQTVRAGILGLLAIPIVAPALHCGAPHSAANKTVEGR